MQAIIAFVTWFPTASPYRFIPGIGVPVLLAILGIVGKKLARGPATGWRRTDFYLGVEFTLAAVSAALLNIFDSLRPGHSPITNTELLLSNFVIALIGIVLFMFVLSLQQDFESNGDMTFSEVFWLLGVSNVIGCGLLLAGILLVPASA